MEIERKFRKQPLKVKAVHEVRDYVLKTWGRAALSMEEYTIQEQDRELEFNSFAEFQNYAKFKDELDEIEIWFSTHGIDRNIRLHSFTDEYSLSIESPDLEEAQEFLDFIVRTLELREPKPSYKGYALQRHFSGPLQDPVKALTLPSSVEARFRLHFANKSFTVRVGNDTWEATSADLLCQLTDIGRADYLSWRAYEGLTGVDISLTAEPKSIDLRVSGIAPEEMIQMLERMQGELGLEASQTQYIQRSAFIGFQFDEAGKSVKEALERWLKVHDFAVESGEGYSSQRISDKVRRRIAEQGIFVGVFTRRSQAGGGADLPPLPTWLIQEASYAAALGKPVFMLAEEGVDPPKGIHGDIEYIRFSRDQLISAFLKLLEGLHELPLSR